jgi:hypothetical protein
MALNSSTTFAMREKYLLQDRIELLDPIRQKNILSVRFGFTWFSLLFFPQKLIYTCMSF